MFSPIQFEVILYDPPLMLPSQQGMGVDIEPSRVKLSSLPFFLNLGTPDTFLNQRFQASNQ